MLVAYSMILPRKRLAATPKFEVKRPGSSSYSHGCMAVPLSGYSASNFAGAAVSLSHFKGYKRFRLKAAPFVCQRFFNKLTMPYRALYREVYNDG